MKIIRPISGTGDFYVKNAYPSDKERTFRLKNFIKYSEAFIEQQNIKKKGLRYLMNYSVYSICMYLARRKTKGIDYYMVKECLLYLMFLLENSDSSNTFELIAGFNVDDEIDLNKVCCILEFYYYTYVYRKVKPWSMADVANEVMIECGIKPKRDCKWQLNETRSTDRY